MENDPKLQFSFGDIAPKAETKTAKPSTFDTVIDAGKSLFRTQFGLSDFAEPYVRHGLSEIASTPAIFGLLAGVGEGAYEYAFDDADTAMEAALTDEGRTLLKIMEHPKATKEEIELAATAFDPQKHLNWGMRTAADWYEKGSKYGGELIGDMLYGEDDETFTRKPGEVELHHEIGGIFLSVLPGLPASVMAKLSTTLAKKVGQQAANSFVRRVAQSVPGRISGRVAMASGYLVPGTFPLTAGNVALNFGAATALNDVMRTWSGETSLINYALSPSTALAQSEETETRLQFSAPRTTAAARSAAAGEVAVNGVVEPSVTDENRRANNYTGYGIALIGGGLAAATLASMILRGRSSMVGFTAGDRQFNTGGTSMNPNFSRDEHGKLGQLFTPGRLGENARVVQQQMTDSNATIRSAGRFIGGEEQADAFETLVQSGTRAGAETAVNRVIYEGVGPDDSFRTIPMAKIAAATEGLSNKPFRHGIKGLKGADTERSFFEVYNFARRELIDREQMRGVAAQSVRDAQDKLAKAQKSLANGLADGVKGGTRRKLQQAVQRASDDVAKAQDIFNASADMRPAFSGLSKNDLERIVKLGDAHPDMLRVRQMYDKLSDDMLNYWAGATGNFQEAARLRRLYRGSYRPLSQRANPDVSTRVGAFLRGSMDRAMQPPREAPKIDSFHKRNLDPDRFYEAAKEGKNVPVVNAPEDSITSMTNYVSSLVRTAMYNRTRAEIVDSLVASPKMKPFLRKIGDYSVAQVQAGKTRVPDHALQIVRNGKIEAYEFGDGALRSALDFSPAQALSVFNFSRRMYQKGMTGSLNPGWAPAGWLYDYFATHVTRKKGRAFGMIDGAVQSISNGKGYVPGDPTALLDSMYGTTQLAGASLLRNFGEWFVNELAESNGLLSRIAQNTAGRKQLEAVGHMMLDRYARTTAYMLEGRGRFGNAATIMHSPHDAAVRPLAIQNSLGAKVYQGLLESVHNGVKMGYFSRNYQRLRRRYKGKIPQKELDKLVQETRELAGDPTKAPGSQTMNKVLSTLPYGNITIQSTQHVIGTSMRRVAQGDLMPFFGLMTGTVIPAAMGVIGLTSLGDEAMDWYYNKLPVWRRTSRMFMPNPFSDNDTGKFDPVKDVIEIPIAPELVPWVQATIAGLEGMGFIEDARIAGSGTQDALQAGSSFMNLLLPPLLTASIEGMGSTLRMEGLVPTLREDPDLPGAVFQDRAYLNSESSRVMMDVVTALAGTAGRMAFEALDTYDHARDDDKTFYEALDAAMDRYKFEAGRRVPVFGKSFFGIDVQYSSTPITDKYYETVRDLAPVHRAFDVLLTGRVGGREDPARTFYHSDRPADDWKDVDGIPANVIASVVSQTAVWFEQPAVDWISSQMARTNEEIAMLQGNRSGDPQAIQEQINELQLERQEYATMLVENFVKPWEQNVLTALGEDLDSRDFLAILEQSLGG